VSGVRSGACACEYHIISELIVILEPIASMLRTALGVRRARKGAPPRKASVLAAISFFEACTSEKSQKVLMQNVT
jgi:Ni,Fe-hydrogenase III small subunit